MSSHPHAELRGTVLQVIVEMQSRNPTDASLQQLPVLKEVARRLNVRANPDLELAILTVWSDLFRTGLLAWGRDLSNPNAPHFHVTGRGRATLARLSRDPGNPAGYLAHLRSLATLDEVADSYLVEGLACFVAGLHKAAAVMLGAAAESMALRVRDDLAQRLTELGIAPPKGLADWRIKTVNDAVYEVLGTRLAQMPHELRATYQAYWPAFTQQIRTARNEAGHPVSVEPVSEDTVHAGFLAFPEIARTGAALRAWIPSGLKS